MPAFATAAERLAYAARVRQFLAGVRFPASKDEVVRRFQRCNTPMEIIEDALDLPETSYDSATAVANEIVAIREARDAYSWTSRVMTEQEHVGRPCGRRDDWGSD